MTGLWGHFFTFLAAASVPLITRIIRGLGGGVASYYGADYFITYLTNYLQNTLSSMPLSMYQMMGLLGIFECVNIIISAFATILLFKGFSTGKKKTNVIFDLLKGKK